MSELKTILHNGLWKNNPALVQLLGLCPLLAVSGTVINGLGLGIATLFVLMGSNICVSLIRHYVPQEIRIPVFVMIIASFVTCVELLMNAFTYTLYQSLGIFIPLIVTNCVIIGRAEAFASRNNVGLAAWDGFVMGIGFTAVLAMLGACRELLGQGTLLSGADQLFGDWASELTLQLFHTESHFLLAILPPGAFIAMGLFIAAKNAIDAHIEAKKPKEEAPEQITRVRVTKVTQ